jgi:glycerol kinase
MTKNTDKFIAALDIGTTTIRCYIFDHEANIVGSAFDAVSIKIILYKSEFWNNAKTLYENVKVHFLEIHIEFASKREVDIRFIIWDLFFTLKNSSSSSKI